jgi:hypothetical protein
MSLPGKTFCDISYVLPGDVFNAGLPNVMIPVMLLSVIPFTNPLYQLVSFIVKNFFSFELPQFPQFS